jgi:hypothetical protein
MKAFVFRAGSRLFLAEKSHFSANVIAVSTSNIWRRVERCKVTLDPRLIIREGLDVSKVPIVDTNPIDIAEVVRKEVLNVAARGADRGAFVGIDVQTGGYGFLTESKVEWMDVSRVFEHGDMSQAMALDGVKEKLMLAGLFSAVSKEAQGNSLVRSLNVYMREKPFVGVTKLHEGTLVTVEEYTNGCVRLNADGENFWYPIEESFFEQPQYKDDHYYFTLDADYNKIPDPLEYLPSKVSLDGNTVNAYQNWNQQPDLPVVAGHFSSEEEIENKDTPEITASFPEGEDPTEEILQRVLAGDPLDDVFREEGGKLTNYKDEYGDL